MSNPKDSPWYSTSTAQRKRKPIGITLSPKALDRLERMAKARGLSRSQLVESLVFQAPIRERGE